MGGEGAEKPDQWNEEDGKELEKEEEKMKKKEKGLLAYLLKFFASLGGKFSILGLVMLPIGEGFGNRESLNTKKKRFLSGIARIT